MEKQKTPLINLQPFTLKNFSVFFRHPFFLRIKYDFRFIKFLAILIFDGFSLFFNKNT
jgi:hypothetical protein